MLNIRTAALSLALNWGGNTRPWRDASVIALLVLAPVVWTMFTFWIRYKGEKALLPVSIFKSFSIYAILVFSFVTRFTMLLGMCVG